MLLDARLALRSLFRSPGFAAAAVATLAIGIGGNAAIFSIVDRVVLRSLPFPGAERLVRIHDTTVAPDGQIYRSNVLPRRWDEIARAARTFDRVTAQRPESLSLVGREHAEPLEGASVSAGSAELLGVVPQLGRLFSKEELTQGGKSGVALVSDRFWRARLRGERSAIGSTLRLADRTLTVVGVLPRGFRFPYHADVWLPLSVEPSDARDLLAIARLAPGATIESAQSEMTALARRLAGAGYADSRDRGIDVMPLKKDLLRDEHRVPLALMIAVAFLLLLACANLAALVLSRSVARQREMAVRSALGATAFRQMRPLLLESLILGMVGGALGLVLARFGGLTLMALVPRVLGEELGVSPARVGFGEIGFVAAVSALAGLACGALPAWLGSRVDPAAALSSGGRSASLSGSHRRALSAFLIGEIAFATVLLAGAALMLQDLARRSNRELGVAASGLLSIEIHLPESADPAGAPRSRRIGAILDAVRRAPGIASAAATTVNPFWGGTWGIGVAPGNDREASTVHYRMTSPGFLGTVGTRILAGRDFLESDRADAAPVAVVSRHLARRFWPRQPAVGRSIVRRDRGGRLIRMNVVGVAADVQDAGDLPDAVYLPYAQIAVHDPDEAIYVMVRGEPGSGAWERGAVRAVGAAEPSVPVAEAEFMDRLYSRSLAQHRLGSSILSGFAAFGLLLATIGVFGLVAFSAGQRRGEIGIRLALGAAPSQIRSLLRGEGARLAAAGCAAGVALALVLHRVLAAVLHDFPASPLLPPAVAAVLFLIAVAAAEFPARRASVIDPSETLRKGAS